MPDYIIIKSETLAANWLAHGQPTFYWLQDNPGATLADVAAALGITSQDAANILKVMEQSGGLVRGYDKDGREYLWTNCSMSQIIIPLLSPASDWVAAHDGASVSQLAEHLGTHFAIAYRVSVILQAERDIRLDPMI